MSKSSYHFQSSICFLDLLFLERSPFLAIELLPKFGFDYRTLKPEIFDHATLETVYFLSFGGFGVTPQIFI
jgi:hypothetical protein